MVSMYVRSGPFTVMVCGLLMLSMMRLPSVPAMTPMLSPTQAALDWRLHSMPSANTSVIAFVRSMPVVDFTHWLSMLTMSAGKNILTKFRA